MTSSTPQIPRRAFLATAATATAITVLKPSLVFGAEANSVLDIGLIGCGGRGTWIAKLFADSGKYRLAACADYFQDKVDAVGEKSQHRAFAPLHRPVRIQAAAGEQAGCGGH